MSRKITGFELGGMIAEAVGLKMDGFSQLTLDCSGPEAEIKITRHLEEKEALEIAGMLEAYEVSEHKLVYAHPKITVTKNPSD